MLKMRCLVRFVLPVFLVSSLGTAQDYDCGSEFLTAMRTVLEGQQQLQKTIEEQQETNVQFQDSLSSIYMTLKDVRVKQGEIESAVNDTKLFLEDGLANCTLIPDVNTSCPNTNTNVEVHSTNEDLIDRAMGKNTLPLKQWSTLVAARVVDGDVATQYHSIDKYRPWWSVDLGDTYVIKTIDILPHPSVPDWFQNIKVFVGSTRVTNGDFSAYQEVGNYDGPWDAQDRVLFHIENVGRYVAIQGFSGTHFLALMDVKVMA